MLVFVTVPLKVGADTGEQVPTPKPPSTRKSLIVPSGRMLAV